MATDNIHEDRYLALRVRRRIMVIALAVTVLAAVAAVLLEANLFQIILPCVVAVTCAVAVVTISILIGYEQDMMAPDD